MVKGGLQLALWRELTSANGSVYNKVYLSD